MQFAKVFEIQGTQVLCVLQPRDEDGLPEVKMVTYVGNTCVVVGNRLVPLGAPLDNPVEVLARTRQLLTPSAKLRPNWLMRWRSG